MFSFIGTKNYRCVNDLEIRLSSIDLRKQAHENRLHVKIAVIDDGEFHPLKNLQNHGYNIKVFCDLESVYDIAAYNIILCDLSGVGLKLNPALQGAHIIKEIKQKYPEKFVIAYTGGTQDTNLYQKSIMIADRFTQKDTTIEDWVNLLDEAIISVANPVEVWKAVRPKLLDAGVAPYELTLLEDSFVRGFYKGKTDYKKALETQSDKLQLNHEAKAIISSIIKNAMFHIITYSLDK